MEPVFSSRPNQDTRRLGQPLPIPAYCSTLAIKTNTRLRCDRFGNSYFMINFPDGYQVLTHNGCVCNEARAMELRHHIKNDLPYNDTFIKEAFQLLPKPPLLDKVSMYKVANNYVGAKRNRYLLAIQNIKETGLLKKHSYVQLFVKADKMPLDKILTKPPRAIQYRTPEFNILLAQYLQPFEHWFYGQPMGHSNTRVVAKGLNYKQRAELLREKWVHYRKPKAWLIDYSRYDSHILISHLKALSVYYRKAFKHKTLHKLLRFQRRNRGFTRGGLKYKVDGTTMSGDFDTALKGTAINIAALLKILKESGIIKYDFLVDGDDGVLILEEDEVIDMTLFAAFGLRAEVKCTTRFEHIEFCQCRPLETDQGWTMCRDPYRALSHMMCCTKRYVGKAWIGWLRANANCEYSYASHIPIQGVVARELRGKTHIEDENLKRRMEMGYAHTAGISDFTRVSYYKTWGMSITYQLLLEKTCLKSCMGVNYSQHGIKPSRYDEFCSLATGPSGSWKNGRDRC